jgi:hypothetical protein
MPKYEVTIVERIRYTHVITVEADDEDDAAYKAEIMAGDEEINMNNIDNSEMECEDVRLAKNA